MSNPPNSMTIPNTIRAQPTTPDFSHGPTLLALLCVIITVPLCLTFFILLIKRRRHYPIAGRGSNLLIGTSITLFLACIFVVLIGFFYHNGTPCSVITLINHFAEVHVGLLYVLRGWILGFRIEIMNYLAERQWREEKRIRMVKTKSASTENKQQIHLIDVLPAEHEQQPLQLHTSDSSSDLDNDSSTIPGVWFITHRQYISRRFLRLSVFCIATPLHLGYGLMYLNDPDLEHTDAQLHRQGVLTTDQSLSDSEPYGRLTFWNAPICLTWSPKTVYNLCIMFCIIFPILIWCTWTIYMDKKRKAKRVQERLMLTGEQLIAGASSPSSSSSSSSTSQKSLEDEMDSVKRELFTGVLIIIFFTFLSWPLSLIPGGISYRFMLYFIIPFLLFWGSIIKPIRISYALSRRIRDELHVTIRNTFSATQPKGATVMQQQYKHRLKYYNLEYHLTSTDNNQHSYNLLLSFTQKEHSSENLLFLREIMQWTTTARRVEERMGWNRNRIGSTLQRNNQIHPIMLLTPTTSTMNLKRLSTMIEIPNVLPILTPTPTVAASTAPAAASATNLTTTTSDLFAEIVRLKSWIDTIQQDYLIPSAVYEVNLPETMLKSLRDMCREIQGWMQRSEMRDTKVNSSILCPPPFPLSSLYRECYAEVYALIECDSFRRFILTREFESLLQVADEEETKSMEQQTDLVTETAEVVARGVEELKKQRGSIIISTTSGSHSQQPPQPPFRRPSSMMHTTRPSRDFNDQHQLQHLHAESAQLDSRALQS